MTAKNTDAQAEWLTRSRFASGAARNAHVKRLLVERFSDESLPAAPAPSNVVLDVTGAAIVQNLVASLRRSPPEASQEAEAAVTLGMFCIAEQRVLVLDADDATSGRVGDDLNDNGRLAGDRAVSDYLCKSVLARLNIPSTQGPLQSSSYRAGYLSKQARSPALSAFVKWASAEDRLLGEVEAAVDEMVAAFRASSSLLPAMPPVMASRLTFTAYRRVRDELLAAGSGGALEQYLLAGLLDQEMAQMPGGLRVTTKNVGANDRATQSAGDIELRHQQALRSAIEVSAAIWSDKIPQMATAAAKGLTEVTIAANGVSGRTSGDDLAALLDEPGQRLGIDASVVDLHSFMDVCASRISAHGRAAAFTYVYRCLVRYHSRQPELAQRLIDSLSTVNAFEKNAQNAPAATADQSVESLISNIRDRLESGQLTITSVADALELAAERSRVAPRD